MKRHSEKRDSSLVEDYGARGDSFCNEQQRDEILTLLLSDAPRAPLADILALDLPPLDELESVQDVLDNEKVSLEFARYLDLHMAFENYKFYEAVKIFENASPEKRDKYGLSIVRRHILENSEYWVNLPSDVTKKLATTFKFSKDSFDEAKAVVIGLMQANFFESFKQHLRRVQETVEDTLTVYTTTIRNQRKPVFVGVSRSYLKRRFFRAKRSASYTSLFDEL